MRRPSTRISPAVWILATALALAAPAWPADSEPAVAERFRWSPDGATLIDVERDSAERLRALRAFDGETGDPRWSIPDEPLARLREAVGDAVTELAVAPGGDALLVGAGGRWWAWKAPSGGPLEVEALAGARHPRFAPDGVRVAFVRAGDLWTFDLGAQRSSRLSDDGDAWRDGELPKAVRERSGVATPEPFAWSPEGRSIAFYRSDARGAVRLAVVDVQEGAIRDLELEAEAAGLAVGWRWRPDARALGVLWLPAGEASLQLRLCHPERLYCRPLAERPWGPRRPLFDDFRFLDDGYVWGPPDANGVSLARFDTLGRERRRLLRTPASGLEIVALLETTREVAVEILAHDEPGFVRLLLVDLNTGAPHEIASAPGEVHVLISPQLRAWVRPGKDAEGHFSGFRLERLDGTELRKFD